MLKQAQKDQHKAVLVRDELLIERELYKTTDHRVSKHTDYKEIQNRNF